MSWKDTISKNLIKSVKFDKVKFIDDDINDNIIECYNYISCDGKCYWCFECCEYQHINKEK
jgi:hypothetical protein